MPKSCQNEKLPTPKKQSPRTGKSHPNASLAQMAINRQIWQHCIFCCRSRKRRRSPSLTDSEADEERHDRNDSDTDVNDDSQEFDTLLHTPKRRKLRTTSRYIYDTLFIEGKDSDLTLNALNKEWKLHKVSCFRKFNTQNFTRGRKSGVRTNRRNSPDLQYV